LFARYMKIGTSDAEEWEHAQDAVSVNCDLLPDLVTVIKDEYPVAPTP